MACLVHNSNFPGDVYLYIYFHNITLSISILIILCRHLILARIILFVISNGEAISPPSSQLSSLICVLCFSHLTIFVKLLLVLREISIGVPHFMSFTALGGVMVTSKSATLHNLLPPSISIPYLLL